MIKERQCPGTGLTTVENKGSPSGPVIAFMPLKMKS